MAGPTFSPCTRTGADVNRLQVVARGDKISLYANGDLLTTVTDSTYNEEVGFVACTCDNSASLHVLLDNLVVYEWD